MSFFTAAGSTLTVGAAAVVVLVPCSRVRAGLLRIPNTGRFFPRSRAKPVPADSPHRVTPRVLRRVGFRRLSLALAGQPGVRLHATDLADSGGEKVLLVLVDNAVCPQLGGELLFA